jgi:hypothetical protein
VPNYTKSLLTGGFLFDAVMLFSTAEDQWLSGF